MLARTPTWQTEQCLHLLSALEAILTRQISSQQQLADDLRLHANLIDPQFMRVFWLHVLTMHYAITDLANATGRHPDQVWRQLLRSADLSLAQIPEDQLYQYVKWDI